MSVSKSGLEAVAGYIQNQRAHHEKRNFQEEYIEFLQKHNVEYDERYLWVFVFWFSWIICGNARPLTGNIAHVTI